MKKFKKDTKISKIVAIVLIMEMVFMYGINFKKVNAADSVVYANTPDTISANTILKNYANYIEHQGTIFPQLKIKNYKNYIKAFQGGEIIDDKGITAKDSSRMLVLLNLLVAGRNMDNGNDHFNENKNMFISSFNDSLKNINIFSEGNDTGKKDGGEVKNVILTVEDTNGKTATGYLHINDKSSFAMKYYVPDQNILKYFGISSTKYPNPGGGDQLEYVDTNDTTDTNLIDCLIGNNKFKGAKIVIESTSGNKYDLNYGGESDTFTTNDGLWYLMDENYIDENGGPKTEPTPTPTPDPTPDTTFTTELSYKDYKKGSTAETIGEAVKADSGKAVTVTSSTDKTSLYGKYVKDGNKYYYIPSYDTSTLEDHDVNADIVATSTGDSISAINPDKNKLGESWNGDKSKNSFYKFESAKASNGIVDPTEYTLTGSDNNSAKQSVGVKWQFRIVKIEWDPATPTENTDQATCIITANLPIDGTNLPEGFTIGTPSNPNDVYKAYKIYYRKDGDVNDGGKTKFVRKDGNNQNPIDIDTTAGKGPGGSGITYIWPNKDQYDTKLDYSADIDGKDVGGKQENGIYIPNYDENNPKKDADVTATITTTTEGATIEQIKPKNGGEYEAIGASVESPNSYGWYYSDESKTKISKIYPFDTYDNSKANGIVDEWVISKKGSSTKESEQKVAIKWTFRIIEKKNTPNNDGTVTQTIETNLPMDPDKIPVGWSIVPNTDNHMITRTISPDDGDIDENVDVYQNGTGDKITTNVTYSWPKQAEEKQNSAPSHLPKTGAQELTLLFVLFGVVSFAVIIRKKRNNIFKKRK